MEAFVLQPISYPTSSVRCRRPRQAARVNHALIFIDRKEIKRRTTTRIANFDEQTDGNGNYLA
jgi:hypothetical protein